MLEQPMSAALSAGFQPFAQLTLTAGEAAPLGLAPGILRLQRVWPQAPDHFGLEYADQQGRLAPGQWLGDQPQFLKIFKATARLVKGEGTNLWADPVRQIFLQPGGADRRLVGLAPLLNQEQGEMIVHRPERRAVVRLRQQGQLLYAKVVRPERTAALVATMQQMQQLAAGHFRTPAVQAYDAERGILYLTALPGKSVGDLLDEGALAMAAHHSGLILQRLHRFPLPATAQPHTAEGEIGVMEKWLQQLRWLAPTTAQAINAQTARIDKALRAATTPVVLLHRDYYDKQIFLWVNPATGSTEHGLLDFDLLAVGEAALDLANVLVHFELRTIQGRCTWAESATATSALLAAYEPSPAVAARIAAYADATRLRLACVYSCRPAGVPYVEALLARLGRPVGGA